MKREYEFKVRLNPSEILPILHIQVLKRTYPIDFTEINIPVIVERKSQKPDYFLDFAQSFDSDGCGYKEAYKCRTKERGVLNLLEKTIHPYVTECLAGNEVLPKNGKKFKFSLEDGYTPENRRCFRGKKCRAGLSYTRKSGHLLSD
jgi:hypothetical protein